MKKKLVQYDDNISGSPYDKQKRLVELNNKIVYRKSEKFRRIYKMISE